MSCRQCHQPLKSANRDGVCRQCRMAVCDYPSCQRTTRKRPGETPYCKYHAYQRRQRLSTGKYLEAL